MKTIASKYHDIILNNQSIKNKQSIIQHLPASEKKQIQILKHRIRQDRWENVKLRVSLFFDLHLHIDTFEIRAWWLEYGQIVQYFAVGLILTALVVFTIYQGVK